MKVLVTGGAGFIGTYLVERLVENGHEVVILDSYVNYVSPEKSNYPFYLRKRLERLDRLGDRVEIVESDIRNQIEVARTIRNTRPDQVVHLASLPIATVSNDHPEEATTSTVTGTVNVLESLREIDSIERIVYASSSMIYGDFKYRPADEVHPKNPKGIYGGGKLAAETMTKAFANQLDIEYTIVRPSAVYGPTDANRRVSQIFVENALKGKELVLHNGGEQPLDFTYVTDTAQGFELAVTHENAADEVFNITRGEPRTIRELAEAISEHIPNVEITTQEVDTGRPKRGALDITKARELLGYEPAYSLEEGIAEYIEYVRNVEGSLNGH